MILDAVCSLELNKMSVFTIPKISAIPIRSVIWVMIFTCTLVLYVLRTNMSIILLAMVSLQDTNSSSASTPECKVMNSNERDWSNQTSSARLSRHGINYDWDSKLQGLILGAYFWGFVVSNIPAAALAEKFGPRKSISISFAFSSLLTLLGPLCAAIHPYMLLASRFFIGLFAGVVYPAIHCLISKWVPPAEKGKFISATLGGSLGTVITWPLLGNVTEHMSWDWAFYISGIMVSLWTILWVFSVYDSPKEHPWINENEREHIVTSLSGTLSAQKRIPPYKCIFLSVPAWALCIAQFGNLWGLFFLMTAGPKFMSSVLGFNLGNTGFLAALPYLARMIAGFIFGSIGDLLVRRELMGKTSVRKSFMILSHIVPGLLLVAQTFVGCQVIWVIILLTLSLASNGASTITNLSNAQDLAPNFAGSIYGIANCIGSTTGFISPMVVGYITADHNGLDEWHSIFYIGALVYIGCGIFFAIFGSGEIQVWNYAEEEQVVELSKNQKDDEGFDNVAFDKGSEHTV